MMELKLDNVENEVMQVISELKKLPIAFDNFKLYALSCLMYVLHVNEQISSEFEKFY